MKCEWPLTLGEFDFSPIPESWIEHPNSVDAGRDGPGVYAVSAASYGSRTLRLRYIHPTSMHIHSAQTAAVDKGNGLVPEALINGRGWPRVLRPNADSTDVARQPEIDHFRELWETRLDVSPRVMADGGTVEIGFNQCPACDYEATDYKDANRHVLRPCNNHDCRVDAFFPEKPSEWAPHNGGVCDD